jgi:hypothetical protein
MSYDDQMAYRDLAAALARIEQLEAEHAVLRAEIAELRRPRFDWVSVLACVTVTMGALSTIALLAWLA